LGLFLGDLAGRAGELDAVGEWAIGELDLVFISRRSFVARRFDVRGGRVAADALRAVDVRVELADLESTRPRAGLEAVGMEELERLLGAVSGRELHHQGEDVHGVSRVGTAGLRWKEARVVDRAQEARLLELGDVLRRRIDEPVSDPRDELVGARDRLPPFDRIRLRARCVLRGRYPLVDPERTRGLLAAAGGKGSGDD